VLRLNQIVKAMKEIVHDLKQIFNDLKEIVRDFDIKQVILINYFIFKAR